jgi:hypothetical protein
VYLCTFGISESTFTADGLPNVAGAMTDQKHVDAVLRANHRELLASNPGVRSVSVGVGFARAWEGQNGGAYEILPVHDYAIMFHVASPADCPRGKLLPGSVDDVPIFYTVG